MFARPLPSPPFELALMCTQTFGNSGAVLPFLGRRVARFSLLRAKAAFTSTAEQKIAHVDSVTICAEATTSSTSASVTSWVNNSQTWVFFLSACHLVHWSSPLVESAWPTGHSSACPPALLSFLHHPAIFSLGPVFTSPAAQLSNWSRFALPAVHLVRPSICLSGHPLVAFHVSSLVRFSARPVIHLFIVHLCARPPL